MSAGELEGVESDLEPEAPDSRQDENLEASVLTSADTKLAYNKDEDRFEAVIVGDINAFPEGLMEHSRLQGEDITGRVSDALTEEMEGEVVVNLPKYAFTGDQGLVTAEEIPDPQEDNFSERVRELGLDEEWLIEEKLKLAKGSEYGKSDLSGIPNSDGVEDVHLTYGGEGLESENGEIVYNGEQVAGCVNLSDRGEKLTDRITGPAALSNIVNAPTAVWNSDLEDTQKPALMDKANSVVEEVDQAQAVDASRIQSREEIYEMVEDKFSEGESVVLKTDPMGSWGDSIVVFDYEEFEEAVERQFVKGEYAGRELLHGENEEEHIQKYIDVMIESESARVSEKSNRDDVELVGEDGFYSRGDTDYAVIEHAAAGTTEIDGDTYHIVESEDGPIDFVPLTVSDGEPSTASYIARVSDNDDNLNVNRGSDKFDVESLEQFYSENSEIFDEAAGREVQLSELEDALDDAGQVAYMTRNLTAYDAERGGLN
jgi:hypothetical protein